jgi:hypothetical protein
MRAQAVMAVAELKFARGRGTLLIREIAPDVYLFNQIGYFDDVKIVEDFCAWFDRRVVGSTKLDMFWDTSENTGYKTDVREAMEHWQRAARPHIASSVVLVRSRLMQMALSITAMVLGSINKVISDPAKFQAYIRDAIRASQARNAGPHASPSAPRQ